MFSKKIRPFFQGGIRNLMILFAVVGLGAMIYGYRYDQGILSLGIVILLITIAGLSGYYGILIDYQNQRYKTYLSFLMVKTGSWKPLPLLSKILITPYKRFGRSIGSSTNIYEEIFVIKLIPAESDEAIVASIGYYGDLVLEADTLSKELGVPAEETFR